MLTPFRDYPRLKDPLHKYQILPILTYLTSETFMCPC
jgi:hypothetical protein